MPASKEKTEKGNLLTIISPSTDRLRLLPIEIRSSIYKFVLETFTVHVTRKLGDDEPIAYKRLLSPPGKKHIATWGQLNINNPRWSASTHLSLRRALRWVVDNGLPPRGPWPRSSIMSEIIHELTGDVRSRKHVSSRMTVFGFEEKSLLKPVWSGAETETMPNDQLLDTKRQVEVIHQDCVALLRSRFATFGNVQCLLGSVQAVASQLQSVPDVASHFSAIVQVLQSVVNVASHLSAATEVEKKRQLLLMSKANPTLNSDVNILRDISHMVADDSSDFDIDLADPLPANYFSLTSVSRFYRLDALPILASSIVYDFDSKLSALHDFRNCLSPDSQRYLQNVKITMVEGFMLRYNRATPLLLEHTENTPLISESALNTYINTTPPTLRVLNTTLPTLRVLNIDLWPRDPTRTDTGNKAWGPQSEALLRSLTDVKAKVRLEMRWTADCERFEREYVRGGAWVRVWGEEGEELEGGNGEMCHRFYETRGGG